MINSLLVFKDYSHEIKREKKSILQQPLIIEAGEKTQVLISFNIDFKVKLLTNFYKQKVLISSIVFVLYVNGEPLNSYGYIIDQGSDLTYNSVLNFMLDIKPGNHEFDVKAYHVTVGLWLNFMPLIFHLIVGSNYLAGIYLLRIILTKPISEPCTYLMLINRVQIESWSFEVKESGARI